MASLQTIFQSDYLKLQHRLIKESEFNYFPEDIKVFFKTDSMLPCIDHSRDAGVICMPVQTPSLVHLCYAFCVLYQKNPTQLQTKAA